MNKDQEHDREACLGDDLGVAWLMAAGVEGDFSGLRVGRAGLTLGQKWLGGMRRCGDRHQVYRGCSVRQAEPVHDDEQQRQ